jgi:hypothetical protein
MSDRYVWGGNGRDRFDCSALIPEPGRDLDGAARTLQMWWFRNVLSWEQIALLAAHPNAADRIHRVKKTRTWWDAACCTLRIHRAAVDITLYGQRCRICSCEVVRLDNNGLWRTPASLPPNGSTY